MKKQVNYFVAMILCATALFVHPAAASSHIIARFTPGETAKTIEVQLANLQKKRTQVAIQDVHGKLWFSEYIDAEDGYTKKLNLTGMPDGAYLCFVQNKSDRHTRAFRLTQTTLTFFEPSGPSNSGAGVLVHTGGSRPCIARIAAAADPVIRLQLANLDQQDALIRLVALGDGIAFEQKVTGEYGYAKQLNLKGMPPGRYFLYIKIGDASLIQYIRFEPDGLQLEEIQRLEQSERGALATTKN